MKGGLLNKIVHFMKQHRFNKRWKKIVTVLSVIVVFCTTYMLILPAVTMEGNVICGLEEHTHSEECYIRLIIENELICTEEHEHIDECYEVIATEDKPDCGMEEHTHSEPCYDKEDLTAYTSDCETTVDTETTTTAEQADESNTEETTETITNTDETTVTEETTADFTEEATEQTTSVSNETKKTTDNTDEHIHTDDCYTTDETLVCTEWGKNEPWSSDRSSDEFKDKAIKYVAYLINQLPEINEFEEKLEAYDVEENYDAYEKYYTEVYVMVSKAFVNYENLGPELWEEVPNKAHLMEYEWVYEGISAYAVTESRTVEFVNYYDNATAYKSILIHSNNVGYYSSFGFYWWYAVVVDENEYGDLIVTAKYDYNLTDKSNLKPTTSKGFVLLSHGDSNTFDCSIGDEATVNFDYLNTSGYSSGSFGTVTFSEYVAPEPEVDAEEDYVLPEVEDGTSDMQVVDAGGKVTSADQSVIVTKTIDGTELENVFDITLTVQTKTNVQTFLSEPDMAVVIVMDISNTMNSTFTGDTMSRYDAAVEAASNFINQFAENTSGLSKIGFIAFNTSAHEIFELQPCSTAAQANALISEMSSDTDSIISASGYGSARTRFTNVEGGLKRGYDMLASSGNANQYIILLTDGFPTTYLIDNSDTSTNYNGYEPYSTSGTVGTDGVFYDSVLRTYCKYGTSYSDKASIKAREMATKIKDSGAKIFSVGVDVAGQTVQEHINNSSSSNSIVDRTGTTYEIGGANDLNAYKNWLGNSIGSGYYYDSVDREDITNAFNTIFEEIRKLNSQTKKTVWTATDPLPVLDENMETVEFIHFFDIYGQAQDELIGEFAVDAEDTAYHENDVIHWDLKKSGYTTSVDPDDENTTWYYYSVKYRVRLENELTPFVEEQVYETNGDAFLEYRTIVVTNDVQEISDTKTVYFPKPSVKGYLSEFSFLKQNSEDEALSGAVFALTHDTEDCSICRGDETAVTTVGVVQDDGTVEPYTATSDSEGKVSFTRIPSGHTYSLTETTPPVGYVVTKNKYNVVVSYDEITITEISPGGVETVWTGVNDVITNYTGYVLPATGGPGVTPFYMFGGLLVIVSLLVLYNQKKTRKEGDGEA